MAEVAHAEVAHHEGEHTALGGYVRHGVTKWYHYFTFNTDHKIIGIQYMVTAFIFFMIGGLMAMLIRAELLTPEVDLGGLAFLIPGYNELIYNGLFSVHATIMIFLWIIPFMSGGFGNYMVPLMLGADDMAFPKLNAMSYWLYMPGGVLLILGMFVRGMPQAGWTSYPPLSLDPAAVGQTIWILSLMLVGTSTLLGAINFLVTIATMRAPGMSIWQMPLFVWSIIATASMIVLSTPMLTGALIMLLMDREFGSNFFVVSQGGDPLLWQHLFWFYSHPAVYIMVLPGMGVISEVVSVFSRKPIFGYKPIALSSMAIALLSFTVWAHHMFTSGMDPRLRIPFMVASMIIAVPTGIKIFSWLATIWGGKLRLNTAMLFSLSFIALFTIGGLSGITLAAVPFDLHVHDTYYIVAHLHYVLFGGAVMAAYSGIYYWFPKVFGRKLNEFWGQVHFWLSFVAMNLTFLPQHWLGMQGMPRRYAAYAPEFQTVNQISSLGAFLLGISVLPLVVQLVVVVIQARREKNAGDNPWRALTLEWQTTSPPPLHNFETPPIWEGDPYGYGEAPEPVPVEKPAEKRKPPKAAEAAAD